MLQGWGACSVDGAVQQVAKGGARIAEFMALEEGARGGWRRLCQVFDNLSCVPSLKGNGPDGIRRRADNAFTVPQMNHHSSVQTRHPSLPALQAALGQGSPFLEDTPAAFPPG